jgi:hypothetical protein
MIIVTAQIEYHGKTLYTELDGAEEAHIKDRVRAALTDLGAEVAVVDVEDDGF